MIYIETSGKFPQGHASGMCIETELLPIVEITLAQQIFNSLEKEKVITKISTSCNTFEIDFMGTVIRTGTYGDDSLCGSFTILEKVAEFLGNHVIEVDNMEVLDTVEGNFPITFKMSNTNYLIQKGNSVTVIVID